MQQKENRGALANFAFLLDEAVGEYFMYMANERFTIIVPTRERPETLGHCLRTLVRQDYDNLSILVSDNCSQDETPEVVRSFKDRRIRYVNTGRRLGMAQNWEFALSHVQSGWVTFLGDDDGLLPGAIELLTEVLAEFPCEAANSPFCTYFWPNNGWSNGASLAVPTNSATARYVSSLSELSAVMAGKSYVRLPWLYQGGFATIGAINRARSASGNFFMSQTPDVYSAIALAAVTEQFLRVGIPLAIAGASKHSSGVSATNEKSHGGSWGTYLSEENLPFHSTLIFSKAYRLLVYECYLQSEFLHGNRLAISLQNQLQVAVAENGMEPRQAIREHCQRIAERNGIPFNRRSLRGLLRVIKADVGRQARRVANVPTRRLLIGEEQAGRNVYEASLKARDVISEAAMRTPLQNGIVNIVAELAPRSVARRLNLVRFV